MNRHILEGGLLDRLSPGFSRSSFRKVFDYHPPGYLSALEYLFPPWSCQLMLYIDLELGPETTRTSEEWFEQTRNHEYPLTVNRVWRLCDDLVRNQANVIVSLDRKSYAGSPWLDLSVHLKATHGSLTCVL